MKSDPRPEEPDAGRSDSAFAPMEPGPEQLRAGHPTTTMAGSALKARVYFFAGAILVAVLLLILVAI